MSTNQTIDGVSRELLERFYTHVYVRSALLDGDDLKLRALLDKEVSGDSRAPLPQGESVTIEAVAVTRENGEGGLRLEWLLEGGIAQMEAAGMVLFAIPEANDLCDEDGSAEVYLTPPQAEQTAPVAVVQKYDDTLLPFFALMRRELHANAGKGDRPGWLAMPAETCLLEIFYHLGKLQKAVKKGDGDGMSEYAADVANMCMMLLDICGALHLSASSEPGCKHDWCPSAMSSTPDYCTKCGEDRPDERTKQAKP